MTISYDEAEHLASLNDEKASFSVIADVIDALADGKTLDEADPQTDPAYA